MAKNGAGDNGAKDVFDLGGWEFRRVKNGLDETQVVSVINELVGQRDRLIRHTEHLSSLTRLAEKTVTEADKLAEEMKTEAIERAKTEAAEIIVKAEAQAQQMGNENKRIRLELKDSVQRLYSQLLSELEGLKRKVVELQVESEHGLSQPAEETDTVAMAAEEIPSYSSELIPTIDRTSTSELEEQAPVPDELDMTTDEGKLELEVLPPIDIMKILEIVNYLDSLPEVENTELIPHTERPSIVVSLREPIPLIDMLRALPEVAYVKEDATGTTGAEGKLRKVQVGLSGKTVPQEAK